MSNISVGTLSSDTFPIAELGTDLNTLLREARWKGLVTESVYNSFSNLESSPFLTENEKARYLLLHIQERKPEENHDLWIQNWLEKYGEPCHRPILPPHHASDTTIPTLKLNGQTPSIEVTEGRSTLLIVDASATSAQTISYQWLKDNTPLHDGNSDYVGSTMPILCINGATLTSRGSYTCNIRASSNTCSVAMKCEPILLTIKTSRVKKILLDRYKVLPDVQSDRKKLNKMTYVNLALVKEKENAQSEFAWSTIHGSADDIKREKDEIQYSKAFESYESEFLVLIEGRPGSGKTTLVHKVAKDWGKGEKILKGASLLFLIPLKMLPKKADLELFDILELFYHDDGLTTTALELIKNTHGTGVCFILDGLDEYPRRKEESSVVFKLIHKTYLQQAMVIIASRPVATAELRTEATLSIEVIGFLKEQILDYIEKYNFSDSSSVKKEKAIELKAYLLEHVNIFRMCFLPLNAFMICILHDKTKHGLPQTECEIYKQFTLLILSRDSNQRGGVKSFEKLPEKRKIQLNDICKIAFQMTVSHDQVFEDDDLVFSDSESSLGLITIDVTEGLYSEHHLYSFVHLTFQEFLAAYHLSIMEVEPQMEMVRKHAKKQHMQVVMKFLCGLICFKDKENIFEEIVNSHQDSLFLCHCAYESQQDCTSHCLISSEKERNSLSFRDKLLNPFDFVAIHHVIAITASIFKDLTLHNCSFGGNTEALTDTLDLCSSLQSLNLSKLDLSCSDDAADIFARLETFENLTTLVLSENGVNNEGAIVLAKSLEKLCNIESLELTRNEISAAGICNICTALKQHEKLRVLKLSRYEIVPHNLSCSLKICTQLQTLSLEKAQITDDCAVCISKCLCNLIHLKLLVLCHNHIGDTGAVAVAESLNFCRSLQQLDLSRNEIENYGAYALAENLKECKTLKALDISHNSITDVGFRRLVDHIDLSILTLHNNCIGLSSGRAVAENLNRNVGLEELNLSACSVLSGCVINIAEGLQYCQSLTVLNFQCNGIDRTGIKALSMKLKYCINLTTLTLTDNPIGNRGAIALADGLKFPNNKLNSIHLSMCRLADAGAVALGNSFGHCSNLQSIHLDRNRIGDSGAKGIGECFAKCSYLVAIHLSNNNIANEGAIGLADNVKKCKRLEKLYLGRNRIGDSGFYALTKSLRECKSLSKFDLAGNQLCSYDAIIALTKFGVVSDLNLAKNLKDTDKFVEGLKSCGNVETLNLQYNSIGDNLAVSISNGLRFCSSLKKLDLGNNEIGGIGVMAVFKSLKYCYYLEELCISNNKMGDVDENGLSESLSYYKRLHTLVLENNQIGATSASGLGKGLSHSTLLRVLNLNNNQIGDTGTKSLSEGLSHCTSLEELFLSSNGIGDVGVNHLSKSLHHCTNLKKLSLSHNQIYRGMKDLGEGLSHCTRLDLQNNQIRNSEGGLTECLSHCTSLVSLYLQDNQISDHGAVRLGRVLRILPALELLHLHSNEIGDIGARSLSDGLSRYSSLRSLNLQSNKIGDDGALALANCLKAGLEVLDLSDNRIGDVGATPLSERLICCKCLQELHLDRNRITDDFTREISRRLVDCMNLRELSLDIKGNKVNKILEHIPNLHIHSSSASSLLNDPFEANIAPHEPSLHFILFSPHCCTNLHRQPLPEQVYGPFPCPHHLYFLSYSMDRPFLDVHNPTSHGHLFHPHSLPSLHGPLIPNKVQVCIFHLSKTKLL